MSFSVFSQNPTVINDSLVVNQRLYAKEKLVVDKDARFKQDVVVNGDLRIKSDLRVDSTLRVDGAVRFLSNVKMEGLGFLTTLDSSAKFIIVQPNGQLKTVGLSQMNQLIYEPHLCTYGMDVPLPQWSNGLNKLYSACEIVRVGIGTSIPQFTLDVRGIAYVKKILSGNIGATTGAVINGFSQNDSEDLIRLGVKVGVAPEEVRFKIINDGTVYAKEIRVRLVQDFPDYVFEDNYTLMSLYELRDFINRNRHLPNMPIASEVKKGGLGVGELTVRLVEKVEELTLYMIQLKEENDNLRNELDQIKKDIEGLKSLNKID